MLVGACVCVCGGRMHVTQPMVACVLVALHEFVMMWRLHWGGGGRGVVALTCRSGLTIQELITHVQIGCVVEAGCQVLGPVSSMSSQPPSAPTMLCTTSPPTAAWRCDDVAIKQHTTTTSHRPKSRHRISPPNRQRRRALQFHNLELDRSNKNGSCKNRGSKNRTN